MSETMRHEMSGLDSLKRHSTSRKNLRILEKAKKKSGEL